MLVKDFVLMKEFVLVKDLVMWMKLMLNSETMQMRTEKLHCQYCHQVLGLSAHRSASSVMKQVGSNMDCHGNITHLKH